MTRSYLVTGAASGIGQATTTLLREQGHRVLTLDLHDADVVADMGTAAGRQHAIDAVGELTGGSLDAVVAGAGTFAMSSLTVRVNYFGTVTLLEGLRPMLAAGIEPRVVVIASIAVVYPPIAAAVDACLAGDEEAAAAAADTATYSAYSSSKRALARWVRRTAPTPPWAGAGIALNAIGPGVIRTPMIQHLLDDPASVEMLSAGAPMPFGGHAEPEQVAPVLAFLTSPENTLVTGQVLFTDGGAEAVIRGDDIW
jgi:NAD(P)-dependent dehydrogenase (short-subunit alcohol dehydrogenase family)